MLPISENARRMIGQAASHAGMSVSDWLNEVILEAASREGVSELHEVFPEPSQQPEQVDFRPIFARLDRLAHTIQALSQETADEMADGAADDEFATAPFAPPAAARPNRERAIFDQLSALLQLPDRH